MRVITFDIEIAREVSEIGGWEAAKRGDAGVASIALYDTATKHTHIYGPNIRWNTDLGIFEPAGLGNLEAGILHLNSADVLVGFNNAEFDHPALEGALDCIIEPPHFDILQEVWASLSHHRRKGYSLDAICNRTIGLSKSGTGEHAPVLFQQGRIAELHDYNINDVHMTRMLCNFITKNGYILDINGDKLEVDALGAPA